jgi:catechol 2,3-dioxygenase-like lactoylglutathione lyase family enzyme
MVSIGSICLNVTDWKRAARYWAAALGYTPHPQADDVLLPPDGHGPQLALYQRDQTHLDLYTKDATEQRAEVQRLIGLGAQPVPDWPDPDGADLVVLRDTEGNLFCVIGHD